MDLVAVVTVVMMGGRRGESHVCVADVYQSLCRHIHILGSFNNIKVARTAICDLIMGSPPGKIFARLRTLSSRIAERF